MHLKSMDKGNRALQKQLIRFLLPALILLTSLVTVSCTSSVPQELTVSEKLWSLLKEAFLRAHALKDMIRTR